MCYQATYPSALVHHIPTDSAGQLHYQRASARSRLNLLHRQRVRSCWCWWKTHSVPARHHRWPSLASSSYDPFPWCAWRLAVGLAQCCWPGLRLFHRIHYCRMSYCHCGVTWNFRFFATGCCCNCWSRRNRTPWCCALNPHPPGFPCRWRTFCLLSCSRLKFTVYHFRFTLFWLIQGVTCKF